MNRKTKVTAAALAITSLLTAAPIGASASSALSEPTPQSRTSNLSFERYELAVSKVYNKNVSAYAKIGLTLNGKALSSDTRMINGAPYVSLRSFINETTNMSVTYRSAARTLSVKGSGFEMEVIDGSNVIYANGRTFFSMTPSAIMTNGSMYAPLQSIAKALGFGYYINTRGEATLTGGVKPLTHGNTYYPSDAVYWLSRIISAESRGESLLGQIAVGSVVMNRVKSSAYPNTIWGVIFDKKYGVQFSPVLDGTIYAAPTAVSITAAKICLEGFNVNTSALFFLYPKYSTSSWIPNNRQYLFSIGKHDFYA